MENENGSAILISRILSDADSEAERILSEAAASVAAINAKAEKEAAALTEEGNRNAKQAEEAVLQRVRTNAALESKKYLLMKKRELISRAFDEARARFTALPDKERSAFYEAFLLRECEGGETVYPASADSAVIAALLPALNDALASMDKQALKLGKNADIDGGFVLKAENYEKNCSVDAVFALLKETEQNNTATLLFEREGL